MWVRVFNLHFPDKMKSCRHKRHRHLILSWFRAENIPPILLRSLLQRAASANGEKGTKTAKAEARAATSWGEMLAHRECQHLAERLSRETLVREGIRRDPLTIHSDRGPAM